jgi:general secretion pathway protein M
MIEQLKSWYLDRSKREQRLLVIMMALLAAVTGWIAVVRPLDAGLERSKADYELAVERLERVRGDALALESGGPVATEAPQALVNRLADDAGFSPTRVDPGADGRVLIGLASVKPIALTRWLEALDTQGIFVEQISIRPNSDATLAIDATLRARTK